MDEKTFTQAELDSIIKERLIKEKAKYDTQLAEKETELAGREFALEAREMLAREGLPAEMLEALNTSSKEAFEKSLSIIKERITSPPPSGVSDKTPARVSTGGVHNEDSSLSENGAIRKAMGLK